VIGQLRPGEASTVDVAAHRPHPAQVVRPAVVVGEGPLGDVTVQMRWSDVDLAPLDRPLEQAPEVLDAVRVDDARQVLALAVVDLLESEALVQALVGLGAPPWPRRPLPVPTPCLRGLVPSQDLRS
jgi:hypothetical protein